MLPNVASTFPVAALSYSHTSYHWIPVILTRDQHLPYHFTFSGIYGKQWSHLSVCCFFPKGRALYLFFLNFMRFPLAHSSSLLKSLWMASFCSIAAARLTLWCHRWTWWQFSVTSSRSLVKMLNRTCPSTDPCSSLLDTSLQAEHDPLPTTGFYLSSCLPIQTAMYKLNYKKQGEKAH